MLIMEIIMQSLIKYEAFYMFLYSMKPIYI